MKHGSRLGHMGRIYLYGAHDLRPRALASAAAEQGFEARSGEVHSGRCWNWWPEGFQGSFWWASHWSLTYIYKIMRLLFGHSGRNCQMKSHIKMRHIYIYIHVYNISPRLCQHSPGFYIRLCHEDGKGHMFFPSGWILSVTCTSSWLLARYFAVLFPWKAEFWESQMHLAPWTTPFCWQLNELPLRILKILNSQHFFRLIPCHTGKILVFICWFGLIKILYLHLC